MVLQHHFLPVMSRKRNTMMIAPMMATTSVKIGLWAGERHMADSTEQSARNAEQHICPEAVALALHDFSGRPTGDNSNDDPPDDSHCILLEVFNLVRRTGAAFLIPEGVGARLLGQDCVYTTSTLYLATTKADAGLSGMVSPQGSVIGHRVEGAPADQFHRRGSACIPSHSRCRA